MRRLIFVALFLCATACARAQEVSWMHYPAPTIYLTWWAQVEECLGQKRDMNSVRFNVVKTTAFTQSGDSTLSWGLYVDESISTDGKPNIFVGLAWEGVAGIVRHEMAHAIRRDVATEHDSTVFGDRAKCAPLFAVKYYDNPADPPN